MRPDPPFRALAITPDHAPAMSAVTRWLDAGIPGDRIAVLLRRAGAPGLPLLDDPAFLSLAENCVSAGVTALLSVQTEELATPDLTSRLGPVQGVHIKGDPAPAVMRRARALLGPQALLGASVHGPARDMEGACAYVTAAPIFDLDPTSPPGKPTRGQGLEHLKAWAARIPTLALGGVNAPRVGMCAQAGAHGVAGIRLFFGEGTDVGETVDAMRVHGWI